MVLPRPLIPLAISLTWLLYALTWSWGHSTPLGSTYVALALVPLMWGAWIYGLRIAIVSSVLFVPLQYLLFRWSGHQPGLESFGHESGIVGDLGLIAVTILTGLSGDANRRLGKLVASQAGMVASVSHEVRTPLTAVVGIAQELTDNWSTIPEDLRHELVGLIAEQATDMTAIVEDLLTAAKADQGKLTVEPQPIELATLAESVKDQLRMHGLKVSGAGLAWADPNRVRQVIRNLLVNARRYGGSQLELNIGANGAHVWLDVADNGNGIPEDRLDQLFSPFAVNDDRDDSSGLGLALSLRLATLMGGNLAYRRELDRTVFRLSLPKAVLPQTVVR